VMLVNEPVACRQECPHAALPPPARVAGRIGLPGVKAWAALAHPRAGDNLEVAYATRS